MTIPHVLLPSDTFGWLQDWSRLWNIDDLIAGLTVAFSPRLRRSLGRCWPAKGLIRLNPVLLAPANHAVLHETLCHEVAHVAVYRLHGKACRPHGAEWRALMRAAGLPPRARIPSSTIQHLPPPRPRSGPLYEHRCPVCQIMRLARRPVYRWRCAACVAAGLDGTLTIRRRYRSPGSARR